MINNRTAFLHISCPSPGVYVCFQVSCPLPGTLPVLDSALLPRHSGHSQTSAPTSRNPVHIPRHWQPSLGTSTHSRAPKPFPRHQYPCQGHQYPSPGISTHFQAPPFASQVLLSLNFNDLIVSLQVWKRNYGLGEAEGSARKQWNRKWPPWQQHNDYNNKMVICDITELSANDTTVTKCLPRVRPR